MPTSKLPSSELAVMRQRNLSRVVRIIAEHPGVHLSDIALRTGLAVGSVNSLLNALVEGGIVDEEALKSGAGRGRPRRALKLADRWADLVAVRLTRTGIEARAATLAGRVLASATSERRGNWTVRDAAGALASVVAEVSAGRTRPGGSPLCAISFPGVVKDGRLAAEELDWINAEEAALTETLRQHGFNRIGIRNDGSLATLAEWRVGAARGRSNVVVILLGRGLGGSAIIDGRLFRGNGSPYGFGHTPVNPSGPVCSCGLRGCIELYASLQALARRLRETRRLAGMRSAEYAAELDRRAEERDGEVLLALHEAREHLKEFCDLIGALLTPELIVVTGQSAVLAPRLTTDLVGAAEIPVLQGQLGGESTLIGATLAAQEWVLDDPLSIAA